MAELLGLDEETAFLAYLDRHHRALFPLLPERSCYNRRRRQLIEGTNRIRAGLLHDLLPHLLPEERDLCVIASLPVPVVGFPHARGDHRGYGEAAYGRVASKKQTIYGDTLHLLITHSGLILDCALVPANHTDGTLTEQLLMDTAHLTALGDKGYINGPRQDRLAGRNDSVLLTPKRKNQRVQLPAALTQAITHFRQSIETITSQLTGQLHLQRNHAKSVSGLCARVQAKLTARTVGLYLNRFLGQPLLALKPLALI